MCMLVDIFTNSLFVLLSQGLVQERAAVRRKRKRRKVYFCLKSLSLTECVICASLAQVFSDCSTRGSHSYQSGLAACSGDCLVQVVGLVVRRPPRERKIPGSNPACARIFSGSSHTSDLKIGTPVTTLPGAWRYRVSTGTGQPGVSIL